MSGGDNEDAATEERISQILSEAQAAMQKKHTDEQVHTSRFALFILGQYSCIIIVNQLSLCADFRQISDSSTLQSER